jgi:hypothetical protein
MAINAGSGRCRRGSAQDDLAPCPHPGVPARHRQRLGWPGGCCAGWLAGDGVRGPGRWSGAGEVARVVPGHRRGLGAGRAGLRWTALSRRPGQRRTAERTEARSTPMAPPAVQPGAHPGGRCPRGHEQGKSHRPAPPRRWPAPRQSAGTDAAAGGQRAAHPPSTPQPGHGRPAGSRSGTACPTSAPFLSRSRTRAATPTGLRTAPQGPTTSAQRNQNGQPQKRTLPR